MRTRGRGEKREKWLECSRTYTSSRPRCLWRMPNGISEFCRSSLSYARNTGINTGVPLLASMPSRRDAPTRHRHLARPLYEPRWPLCRASTRVIPRAENYRHRNKISRGITRLFGISSVWCRFVVLSKALCPRVRKSLQDNWTIIEQTLFKWLKCNVNSFSEIISE